MKINNDKIITILSDWKNDIARSDTYDAIIYKCMGISVWLKIFNFHWWAYIAIIPAYLSLKKITGYYDRRKGIKGREAKRNTLDDPAHREMYEKINEIYEILANSKGTNPS